MTRWRCLTAALAVAVAMTGLAACTDRPAPSVVVTTNILGDMTRQVVGDQARVTVLMPPGSDPHSFGISSRQATEMSRADLVVANGLGLEEGVARAVASARDDGATVLEVGPAVDPIPVSADDGSDDEIVDPHFWTDPDRVVRAVDVIADAVATNVTGIDRTELDRSTDSYRQQVRALADEMRTAFDTIPPPRRKLVTNHHVFGYLAQRFGLEVIGAIIPGGTTLASPSASDLADLAAAVRTAGVPTIFADSSQPDRLARVLAEQTGTDVDVVPLFSESLTPPGGGAASYLQMMRANTERITTGLTRDR
ncbi:zinc ABC transporter substrate-binding protein AztC [Williamsia sp. SKLECPSW1]